MTPVCTAIEAKYKLKTRSAMAKRFKVTGSGKVIRRHAGKQHLNEKKRPKQLKRLSKETSVFAGDVRLLQCPERSSHQNAGVSATA